MDLNAGYERTPTGDYHDGNWLSVTVTVTVGAFDGTLPATVLNGEESVAFRNELKKLHEILRGDAKFTTLEDQRSLELSGNGRGQILLKGYALHRAGMEIASSSGCRWIKRIWRAPYVNSMQLYREISGPCQLTHRSRRTDCRPLSSGVGSTQ